MSAHNNIHPTVPSENWDDDFEFYHQNTNTNNNANYALKTEHGYANPRLSTTSSHFTEDWDRDDMHTTSILEDKKNTLTPLSEWADPGPSTPTRRHQPTTENWDDDFEDRTDSPMRRYARKSPSHPHPPPRPRVCQIPDESWDEEFEAEPTRDSSPLSKRARHDAYSSDSDEGEDAELGFAEKEEDRTVTARSRRAALARLSTPPPPVPSLPSALIPFGINTNNLPEPFPRSPTTSVFSVPSGRDSTTHSYNSTTHLALRPSASRSSGSKLSHLPPSPPVHKERERRRLRKKSRPPHFEDAVFELVPLDSRTPEDPQTDPQTVASPVTPERTSTPPEPSAAPKQPLLSRIGSVKKRWAVRRKRASMTPSEMLDTDMTPRPPSSLASSSSPVRPSATSWFFRGAGNNSGSPPSASNSSHGELRRERSADRTPTPSGSLDSPTKLLKRKSFGFVRIGRESEITVEGTSARRPTSMQPQGRHVSYSGVGIGRSGSSPAANVSAEDLSEKEGSRGFMGSVRRISLGGQKRHKRTKSATSVSRPSLGTAVIEDPPPSNAMDLDVMLPPLLLPPIELHPPSPPDTVSSMRVSRSEPAATPTLDSILHQGASPSRTGTSVKAPASPQSASLGRAAAAAAVVTSNGTVPRRNSLGDLKIPARISQAQVGLRRDLGMVREFAANIEQLKELQGIYKALVAEVQATLDAHAARSQQRALSPGFFGRVRPRSSTNPPPPSQAYKQLAAAFYTINSKYRISWECAELLIELGSGTAPEPTSVPPTSVSAPAVAGDGGRSRERAVTLAGDESKPVSPSSTSNGLSMGPPIASPPSLAWRASTGRHDLSHRQLVLLREMLNSANAEAGAGAIPEEVGEVDRDWRWGDAMGSTITLPEESAGMQGDVGEDRARKRAEKRRRGSRLGMSGLRDMLRALKRGYTEDVPPLPLPPVLIPVSTTSLSTDSSMESYGGQRHLDHGHVPLPGPPLMVGRRRAKTSTGPESMRSTDIRPTSPQGPSSSLKHTGSPRRPSLASIFRLGQKHKNANVGSNAGQGDVTMDDVNHATNSRGSEQENSSTGEEEDWDRVDSPSEPGGSSTVRGKRGRGRSPYLHETFERSASGLPTTPTKRAASASHSQSSLWGDASPGGRTRPTRLSNVEELAESPKGGRDQLKDEQSKSRQGVKTGSVRSMPPQPVLGLPNPKLAMTPENIKPLLENAKEVHARLSECVTEIQGLVGFGA